MSVSVKVMLSHDYCHFEISKSSDQDLSNEEINEMRKDCMRLCDKAISQYKIAKNQAARRETGEFEMQNFEAQIKKAMAKEDGDRTINEVAMIKQYKDENWRKKFIYNYDYEDDYREED